MAYMEPEIYFGEYGIIETCHDGTIYCPADYIDLDIDETITYATGYLGRLSANGYMDATAWTPLGATDYDAAVMALCDDQDICPRCFDQCWADAETRCMGANAAAQETI